MTGSTTSVPGGRPAGRGDHDATVSSRRSTLVAALVDAAAIIAFATMGRASHEHGLSLGGIASTALPFLVGVAIGWAACLVARRRAPLTLGDGLGVWAGTVIGGMLLRNVTGQGTAGSFIVVAALVTGALLLGWRAARAAVVRRRA